MIQQEENSPLKGFVYWVGIALVVSGAVSLLYVAILVVQIIQSPSESQLIAWVMSSFGSEELLFAGYLNETQFEVRANDELQFILLGLLGLVAISILARVVSTLITSGVALIKFSTTEKTDAKAGDGSERRPGLRGLSR
jgi:hypothetical protein